MNVVIYARFSSHAQNEQSIEGQLKACLDYCKQHNYTVVSEYIDRAISGTTDNRPEFMRMIEDSSKKHFQYVIVYQLDRFSRNRYDSAVYKAKLKKNGVRVLSARENITDDASGILMESVLEGMAEYYSAELSQKIKRGMALNAEKCLATGSNPGLGFRVGSDRRYYVDEQDAAVVVKVFEMYAAGHTVVQICEYLNQQQIKTSSGGEFNKNSLRKMLQNKRYIGTYLYKDKETPGGMPRIIEDELFDKVQKIMHTNKKAPAKAKAKAEYLLTTKLFCGHCKDMFVGISGTSKTGGRIYNYYVCKTARQKKCDKKTVRKEYIEDLIIEECRNQLTSENITKIAKEVVARAETERNSSSFKRLHKLLKDNERKHKNLMAAIMECGDESIRRSLYEQVPLLEQEKRDVEKQIALEQAGQVHLTVTDIKFFLSQLKKGSINNEKYRRCLIAVLVGAIYLYDDDRGKDKLLITMILNTSSAPITIDINLIDEIEAHNKAAEGFVFDPNFSTKS